MRATYSRWWIVTAALIGAGCSAAPTQVVGGGAILSAVPADQRFLAVLTSPAKLSNGAHTGQLEVVTSGGAPLVLDGHSSGGVYDRGTTLWFLGGISVVAEGTPPTPHIYGTLKVWLPGLPAAIEVGGNVRELYPSQDGSACAFMDWDQQTTAATNSGKLVAVAAASCAGGACQPITIDTGLALATTSWRLSSDGRWLFATTRGATLLEPGKAILASLVTGQQQTLSMAAGVRSAMMTPGGDTIAWVEGANQIRFASTGDTTVTRSLTTTAPLIESAAMIAPGDFIAKTREGVGPTGAGTGATSLARLSAAGSMVLPGPRPLEFFVSQYVAGKTNQYVFYSQTTNVANGQQDLWMLDLTSPTAQPVALAVQVATPIASAVAFSDDGSTIEYLDNYDPTSRRGDGFVVPLAKPTRSLVAVGVHNVAFIPGSTRLLYIAAPDAESGAGVLTLLPSVTQPTQVEGVGDENFISTRSSPLRTYYTQLAGRPDDGVWSMQQP